MSLICVKLIISFLQYRLYPHKYCCVTLVSFLLSGQMKTRMSESINSWEKRLSFSGGPEWKGQFWSSLAELPPLSISEWILWFTHKAPTSFILTCVHAWNVSPFLHIWVVDSSFFSCFGKTTRVTLVQNCHQSSEGCSIDFRLANIILEGLKLAWSKENQTGRNGGKAHAEHSFTQARDTGAD